MLLFNSKVLLSQCKPRDAVVKFDRYTEIYYASCGGPCDSEASCPEWDKSSKVAFDRYFPRWEHISMF